MTTLSKEIVLGLGAGVAALITAATLYRYNKRKNNKIPEKWIEVGCVSDLWIYPLKSGKAMKVEEFECTEVGPLFHQEDKLSLKDRGFLIYNEKDGEQRTARNYPKMVLITLTALSEDEIELDAPNTSPLRLQTSILRSMENPELVSCTLFQGELQKCIDCGDEAAKWISQYCSQKDSGLRLGVYSDWKRSVTLEPLSALTGVYKNLRSEDLGIFSDMASYLINNQASLENLNEKLSEDVSPLNFRPNINIVGPKAYEEDNWDWIKIGEDVIFRIVRPCTRCILVNLDPETGIPAPEQAVLRKLREYRLVSDKQQRQIEGNSPAMGIYAGIRKPGNVKLGDKVYVG